MVRRIFFLRLNGDSMKETSVELTADSKGGKNEDPEIDGVGDQSENVLLLSLVESSTSVKEESQGWYHCEAK